MLNICLILHASRSQNLGVGALTVAQVDLLRDIARKLAVPLQITLLDWQDDGHRCVDGDDIRVIPMSRRDLVRPGGAWRHIRAADVVLDIGAGDSFADIYGQHRLNRIFLLKFLVHLSRRPLVLAPQTLGPFARRSNRILARLSLRLSRMVFARDESSVRYLRRIGVARPLEVSSDVALRLPTGRLPTWARVRPAREAVGINVSGLLMSGGYHSGNQFGLSMDYPALIRRVIGAFLDHPDRPEVHLIPHVITPDWSQEDDRTAAEQLAEEFEGVIVAPAFKTPSEAKGYISGLSFMTGSRMHACIAALSSGVAVVPMAYSRKFAGMFGALGYDHVADCRSFEASEIFKRIMEGYAQRKDLAEAARCATQRGRQRLSLYEESLETLLRSLLDKREPAAMDAAGVLQS